MINEAVQFQYKFSIENIKLIFWLFIYIHYKTLYNLLLQILWNLSIFYLLSKL